MEKKLYCVKVVLYVMAENTSEASVAATKARFDIFECTARKADHLRPGWENAIPYNSDDDRTCAEILSSEALAAPIATWLRTADLHQSNLRVPMRSAAVPSSLR
jgi:hypothetical protein